MQYTVLLHKALKSIYLFSVFWFTLIIYFRYACDKKKDTKFDTNAKCIKTLLALCIVMQDVSLPSTDDYFSNRLGNLSYKGVSKYMSKHQFKDHLRYLHLPTEDG